MMREQDTEAPSPQLPSGEKTALSSCLEKEHMKLMKVCMKLSLEKKTALPTLQSSSILTGNPF
jgi:hypothetical protein